MSYQYSARTVPGHYTTGKGCHQPFHFQTWSRYPTATEALEALFELMEGSPARPRRVILDSYDEQGLKFPECEMTTKEARAVIKQAKELNV